MDLLETILAIVCDYYSMLRLLCIAVFITIYCIKDCSSLKGQRLNRKKKVN